jgi:hypothetical protein
MAKIIAPNNQYTGVSASVSFVKGEGTTTDNHLIKWFKDHGYEVIEDVEEKGKQDPPPDDDKLEGDGPKELTDMTVEELTAYANEKGIDIGNSTSVKGILKKIQDAEVIE